MTYRLTWLSLLALGLVACSSGESSGGTSAAHADEPVKSFAHLGPEGEILGVGAIVPVSSFESVPDDDPTFHGVGLEMPAEVRDKTFIQLLRINWLASGHGPSPYDEPHFDLHFYRGTNAEIDAIDCTEEGPFSAAILSPLYQAPTLCVSRMGYHAWPNADLASHAFQRLDHPRLLRAEDGLHRADGDAGALSPARELRARHRQAGLGRGAKTLYPSHLTATYDAAADAYSLELDHFETID